MYFSENLLVVNPVVMTIYDIIIIGQRDILLHGQIAFPLLFVVAENRKHSLGMQGYVQR